jgi:hypothetical protein
MEVSAATGQQATSRALKKASGTIQATDPNTIDRDARSAAIETSYNKVTIDLCDVQFVPMSSRVCVKRALFA